MPQDRTAAIVGVYEYPSRVVGPQVSALQIKAASAAKALEDAGAYAVVLELVPTALARLISQRLTVPTIGIGAGPGCDGQVQVLHDMLGLFTDFVPKHAKRYANLGEDIKEAFTRYAKEVLAGEFPTDRESFTMDEDILNELATLYYPV